MNILSKFMLHVWVLILLFAGIFSTGQALQLNIPAHFRYVKGGTFERTLFDEKNQPIGTETTRVNDFVISRFEVSVQQYKTFCFATGREMALVPEEGWSDPKHPVESISYDDAQQYIRWLNESYGILFRLPDEAEWEFAARGGNQSKGYIYSGSNVPDDVAIYAENSHEKPGCISCMKPNELGIYAMSGNMWEWVSNPANNEFAVIRGGSYADSLGDVRIEARYSLSPGLHISDVGFRVAADAKTYNQYLMAEKVNIRLKKIFGNKPPLHVNGKGFYKTKQFISWDDFDSFFIDYDSKTAGIFGGIDEDHRRITIEFDYTKEQLEALFEIQDFIMATYAGS